MKGTMTPDTLNTVLITPRFPTEHCHHSLLNHHRLLPGLHQENKSLVGVYQKENTTHGTYGGLNKYKSKSLKSLKSLRPDPDTEEQYSRSKSNIVFLKESDIEEDRRLMHRPLVTTETPEWFQDKRYYPQQQAEYLKRLTQKPKGLTPSNNAVSSDTPTGKSVDFNCTLQQRSNLQRIAKSKQTGPESYTDRQRKLQTERKRLLERQQRLQSNSVGKLLIRPLTDISTSTSTSGTTLDGDGAKRPYESARNAETKVNDTKYIGNKNSGRVMKTSKMTQVKLPYLSSLSDSYFNHHTASLNNNSSETDFEFIKDMVQVQQKKVTDHLPTLPGQYTSSIPNIGRRAVRDPTKLFYINREASDTDYIRQVSMYNQERHGYYNRGLERVKKRKYYKREQDQVSESSDNDPYIRFNTEHSEMRRWQQGGRRQSSPQADGQADDDKYSHSIAPCTTPINSQLAYPLSQSRELLTTDDTELGTQYKQHRMHTSDSIYINNVNYGSDDDSGGNINNNGRYGGNQKDKCSTCVFCQNPELIPLTVPNSVYDSMVSFDSGGRDNGVPSARFKDITVADIYNKHSQKKNNKNVSNSINITESSDRKKTHKGDGTKYTGKKKHIVVDLSHVTNHMDLPNVNIEGPSPTAANIYSEDTETNNNNIKGPGKLIRTYKQNELRQREVSNLLEDVQDLNELTKSLQHVSGIQSQDS